MKKPTPRVPEDTSPAVEKDRLDHLSLKIDRLYMRHSELSQRGKRMQAETDEMNSIALEMIPLEKLWNSTIPQGIAYARYKIRIQL